MDDLISRQAAIDLIESIETERLKGNIELIYAPAIKGLRALPPAQPEQLGANLAQLGTDCISRQQAIDALDEQIEQCDKALSSFDISMRDGFAVKVERASLVAFRETLEYLPSAQPEIVRCKDCKHWIPYDWMFSEVWQSQSINDYPEDEMGCEWCDMSMRANDFCSRAERREVTE